MAFKGWAALLNEVMVAGACEHSQQEWDESGCAADRDITVIDRLTATPDGTGVPGLRTEDVTFVERDGSKFYGDWYTSRLLVFQATVGPHACQHCGDVRSQVRKLARAWERSLCDLELVLFTPCSDEVYDDFPVAKLKSSRVNLMAYNARGQAYTSHCSTFEFNQSRGFAGATGTYTNFEEPDSLPADMPNQQLVARKTWTSDVLTFCRDYGTDRCYDLCYDNPLASDNAFAGFIMGCTGQEGYPVTPGNVYVMSGYVRSSRSDINMGVRVWFYDTDGNIMANEDGEVSTLVADTWTRIAHAVEVPVGAVTMMFALDTFSGGPGFESGDTLDATGVLVERFESATGLGTPPFDSAAVAAMLGDYFDGDYNDSDNPVLNGQRFDYYFSGEEFESNSHLDTYTYVPGPDRATNGPFGVVGRPRGAEVRWRANKKQVADILLTFKAVDHRLHILDSCGTPWSYDCVEIEPGSEFKSRCYTAGTRCYTDGQWCYDQEVEDAVPPRAVEVIGDLEVFPTITLEAGLTNPRIQNVTNSKYILFNGVIAPGAESVVIYTEDMVAYQGDVDVSHLLAGSVDFNFEPGEQELRLLSNSTEDDGVAQICWRPAVLTA